MCRSSRIHFPITWLLAVLVVLVGMNGCGGEQPPPSQAAPEVTVLTVVAEPVSLTTELPGRISPVRTAEVRARATGILLRRTFEEGSNVTAGDVLFEIDPAPLEAELASAKAALARATARLKRSEAQAARYEKLVGTNAVSKAEYDATIATLGEDRAALEEAKAAVETATLHLGYARVTAPISGRIGKALVTEGALVSATEATRLAVIHQLDPVYFDFTQSSTEVLRLKRALAEGTLKSIAPGEAQARLRLDDGTEYPHAGTVLFSDVSVDETTGMVTLRAQFPNTEGLLLPGMFARAELEQAVISEAITVPQRTVTQGAGGAASVLVVTPDNKVELRRVEISGAVGNRWIIASGLSPGERILVEGSQKAPVGTIVNPVPYIAVAANEGSPNAHAKS